MILIVELLTQVISRKWSFINVFGDVIVKKIMFILLGLTVGFFESKTHCPEATWSVQFYWRTAVYHDSKAQIKIIKYT